MRFLSAASSLRRRARSATHEHLPPLARGLPPPPARPARRRRSGSTMLGAPVDAVEPLHADLGELVVGLVEEVRQHPNADRLRVCLVNDGTPERRNVVCGAPNVTAGKKYPFARIGTTVPHGKGGAPMKIERAKLRGEVSEGMLCSARELGLGQEHDGILELDTDAAPGHAAARGRAALRPPAGGGRHPEPPRSPRPQGRRARAGRVLPGARSGCPSIPGAESLDVPPARRAAATGKTGAIAITIEDPTSCPRFHAALIRGAQGRPVARVAAPAARGGRRALDQQRGGRHQLRHARAQPADARLRRGHAPRLRADRAARRAPASGS